MKDTKRAMESWKISGRNRTEYLFSTEKYSSEEKKKANLIPITYIEELPTESLI